MSLTLRAYGRTVGVTGAEEVVSWIESQLPPAYRRVEQEPERRWSVREVAGRWVASAEDAELWIAEEPIEAAEAVLSDLELWVAERARRFIFVHGGCAAVDGRAVVLPGYSRSGKTSLTTALVRGGAVYYSDEYAVLDSRGFVRPYPRPLSVRSPTERTPRRVAVESLPGKVGRGPAEVALVADLIYDESQGLAFEALPRRLGMLRLLRHTIPALSRPRASLLAVERATAGAEAIGGTRGDAEHAAEILLGMLSASLPRRDRSRAPFPDSPRNHRVGHQPARKSAFSQSGPLDSLRAAERATKDSRATATPKLMR